MDSSGPGTRIRLTATVVDVPTENRRIEATLVSMRPFSPDITPKTGILGVLAAASAWFADRVTDPKDLVRLGYDAVSQLYRGDTDDPPEYAAWVESLHRQLPANADVLDLGCGCGVPVAKSLAVLGHRVLGVDISAVQLARARDLVPAAEFWQADAATVSFPAARFDAVVCLYALIHMPQDEQGQLIGRIAGWLRPGGWLLATTGATAWTGTEEGWLGGTAPMWWSHPDAAVYRDWMAEARLRVQREEFVPEGQGGHQVFWAQLPASPASTPES